MPAASEVFYVTLVAGFIGLVVLGHALLFSAIYKCLHDNWAFGLRSSRKIPLSDQSQDRQALGLTVPDTLLAHVDGGRSVGTAARVAAHGHYDRYVRQSGKSQCREGIESTTGGRPHP